MHCDCGAWTSGLPMASVMTAEREMGGGGRGWSAGMAAPPLLWCFDLCTRPGHAQTKHGPHCRCTATVEH
eukprot:5343497-Pyramimonas_sp.AAC.1